MSSQGQWRTRAMHAEPAAGSSPALSLGARALGFPQAPLPSARRQDLEVGPAGAACLSLLSS